MYICITCTLVGSANIIACRTVLVFTGVFTFLVDAYPLYAASSLAANSFARSSFGGKFSPLPSATFMVSCERAEYWFAGTDETAAAFPLFGIQMYHKLGYQWATSLLAFLTLAMMPFPYLFFKYGKTLRGKSRFASA